ncbi:SUKH-4 family immunity protein [Streptomyces sp. MS06]|uniref:SUKH-4 family immunity protein n=1 Tax=Streptomyces sp. MS06 TaxID=3385974 RepID=UPI0039A1C06D
MSTITLTQDRPALRTPAGPHTRSGLSLDLPARLLDEAFGRGRVVRFEDLDFPPALGHGPTRRFLREVGLPEEAAGFRLDLDAPLRTLAEYAADEFPAPCALPSGPHRLIRLARLTHDTSAVLVAATGEVLRWHERDALLTALEPDVSSLAFSLWRSARVVLL